MERWQDDPALAESIGAPAGALGSTPTAIRPPSSGGSGNKLTRPTPQCRRKTCV